VIHRRLCALTLPALLAAGSPALADFSDAPLPVAGLMPRADAGDHTKVDVLSDGDDPAAKLPVRSKVKECCGYPLSDKEGFRLSFYWLAYESEYANESYDTDIYTRDGYFIGRFPSAFVYELKLEGSGILRDGRVLNYDGECLYGIGTCFRTLDPQEHPLGRGVQNRPLEPFRSIAVDPRFIPIGSPIYVPELVGVQLPDGTRHDGCLRADDQGGAIKLHKMDFFVESYFNFKFLGDQLWWRLKATPHLDEPRCEYLRLRTPRERDNDRSDWAELHSRKARMALARDARLMKRRQLLASTGGGRGKHLRAQPARGQHATGPAAKMTRLVKSGASPSTSSTRSPGAAKGHVAVARRGR
jgi:3D (Asp-Asp-Asp) domain-containing protein